VRLNVFMQKQNVSSSVSLW